MTTFPATSDNPDGPNCAWYYEADDDVTVGAPANAPSLPTQEGRGHRKKAITHFKESMKADTEETESEVANKQTREPCRIDSQPRPRAPQDAVSDNENQACSETSDGTTEDDEVDAMIENSEASFIFC